MTVRRHILTMIGAVWLLAACASTAATPAATTGRAALIAQGMIGQGAPLLNIRDITQNPAHAKKLTDSKGFDIPGVKLDGKPAGTINIFKDEKQAQLDAGIPAMLGGAGPATKQPWTARVGTVELLLDYRLDPKLVPIYQQAFRAVAASE